MKIGIVGAGAIGGYFAGRLAHFGQDVSILARGKTLQAIRAHGIRLESEGQHFNERVKASDNAAELGVQDVVILAVKAPSLPAAAQSIAPLLGPHTIVVPALNGLPWWYFLASSGALAGHRLGAVDPAGVLEKTVPVSSLVGCVVFPASSSPAPGVIKHASGNRIVFGEPRGGSSTRVDKLGQIFRDAGFAAESSVNIRQEIWLKLLGNMCFNPVSVLVGCSTDRLIDDPRLHRMMAQMMTEAIALGGALGIHVDIQPDARIALTRKLGAVKTSTLQDVESGRPIEIDGILGTVVEAADAIGCPVPLLSAVYALTRKRADVLELLPQV